MFMRCSLGLQPIMMKLVPAMAANRQVLNQRTLPRLANGAVRYGRGWYLIGASSEFAVGDVKSLTYFNQQLVAFRTASGQLSVLDAYCPHLGADLGAGGKVVDESIQCPFHAWRFDQDGQCIDIPYAKHTPKKACLTSWLTAEHSGLAFIWHCPQNSAPTYTVPELDRYGQPGWTDWDLQRLTIETTPREIIENVADSAHFEVVHKMEKLLRFSNEYDGVNATQNMLGKVPGGTMQTTATYYGPAVQFSAMTSAFDSRLLNAHTPIDENSVHLWFGVMMQLDHFNEAEKQKIHAGLLSFGFENDFSADNGGEKDNMQLIHQAIIHATQQGYYDDVQVWEHKLFRPDPILCDGDGPLFKLRKWYAQFYEDI